MDTTKRSCGHQSTRIMSNEAGGTFWSRHGARAGKELHASFECVGMQSCKIISSPNVNHQRHHQKEPDRLGHQTARTFPRRVPEAQRPAAAGAHTAAALPPHRCGRCMAAPALGATAGSAAAPTPGCPEERREGGAVSTMGPSPRSPSLYFRGFAAQTWQAHRASQMNGCELWQSPEDGYLRARVFSHLCAPYFNILQFRWFTRASFTHASRHLIDTKSQPRQSRPARASARGFTLCSFAHPSCRSQIASTSTRPRCVRADTSVLPPTAGSPAGTPLPSSAEAGLAHPACIK